MKTQRKIGMAGVALILFSIVLLVNNASAQTCIPPPNGLVSWWPLDGNADDIQDGNPATFFGTPGFVKGKVGQALQLDGIFDYAMVPASVNLDVGAGSGLTIEGWINPFDVSGGRPIVEWSAGAGATYPGLHLWVGVVNPGELFANLVTLTGEDRLMATSGNVILTNAWQHVALTYDKATGIARLYVNGEVAVEQNFGTITPKTSEHLWFGHRPSGNAWPFGWYFGEMDELEVYNRALSPPEIQAIFLAGSAGKCKVQTVSIDIKPGSFPNSINLSSAGVIPVAILSNATFDATQINPATLSLAGAKVKLIGKGDKYSCHPEDVNGDGLLDLVCQVVTVQFFVEPGTSVAVLEAETFNGQKIMGQDSIQIVP